MSGAVTVRPARADEHVAVVRILEGALLAIDADDVGRAIERGDALVAAVDREAGEHVVGAAVLEPRDRDAHLEAVAVRRDRRGEGIGRALVDAAADRYGRLTARFRPEVREFYEGCGFEVRDVGAADRLRGVRPA